jgi:hypothetical protein
MTTFKIEKDLITYFKNFNTLEDAETYTLEVLGTGWIVTISEEQIIPLTPQQQLEMDIFFGEKMIQQFLIDNRELGSIPVADQLIQLQNFKDVNTLLGVGALKASYDLIGLIPIDQYFTQQRKDKYLNEIYNYLMNNYGKV